MAKRETSDENVVRIKASSSKVAPTAKKDTPKVAKKATKADPATDDERGTPISYFKGAWYELRQVRWPNRRATWSLTGAVLLFTAFFVVVILLLDALFKYIFQLILGS